MTAITPTHDPQELAYRSSDGIEVALYWHGGDALTVHVFDSKTGLAFDLGAEPSRALEVFYHPFAFASDTMLDLVRVDD